MPDSLIDALKDISDTYAASDPALMGAREVADQKLDLRKMGAGSGFLAGFLKSVGSGGLAALGTSQVMGQKAALNKDYSDAMDQPDDASRTEAFKANPKLAPLVGAMLLHQQAANEKLGQEGAAAAIAQAATLPNAAKGIYSNNPTYHQDLMGNVSMQPGQGAGGNTGQDPSQGGMQNPIGQSMIALQSAGVPAGVAGQLVAHQALNQQDLGQQSALNTIGQQNDQDKEALARADDYQKNSDALNTISQKAGQALEGLKGIGGKGASLRVTAAQYDKLGIDPNSQKIANSAADLSALGPKFVALAGASGLPTRGQAQDQGYVEHSGMTVETPEEARKDQLKMMQTDGEWLNQRARFVKNAHSFGLTPKDADNAASDFDRKYPLYSADPKTGGLMVNKRPNIAEAYGTPLKKQVSKITGQARWVPQ